MMHKATSTKLTQHQEQMTKKNKKTISTVVMMYILTYLGHLMGFCETLIL